MEIISWLIIVILFISSLIGVILPVLPDTILLWLGFLFYRFTLATTPLGFTFWFSMAVISILILGSDILTNAYFVKRKGGSRWASLAAVVGLLAGSIFMGPPGLIVGPFLLVFLVALLERKDRKSAFKLATGTILAFFSSSFIKIILQLIMIAWFLIRVI